MSQLLVTSALPYANGSIHIGHMVEHVQSDVYVRARRLMGDTIYFVCADDAHGTPVMLRAEQLGKPPEQFIEEVRLEHQRDLSDFGVAYDHYGSTHSDDNRALVERVYHAAREGGYVTSRSVEQFYDADRQMFLPDRFVKGTCPKCGAADQYGDSCEVCGSTYSPQDLIDPYSVVSGSKPERRSAEHYFIQLGKLEGMLRDWLASGPVATEVRNKLEDWFQEGLRDWDISRDAPYFGFRIPDTEDKFFYVWLDAPVGYLASFQALAEQRKLDFSALIAADSDLELQHFIGKDIVYFHTLFWPAMLHVAGLMTPDLVHVHGFLTVNGEKMSKSRGTFILARTYLDHLDADYLRYYFASKLNASVADIDLNLDDFRARVNADLVGKYVNIASRCAGFISKRFAGQLADSLGEDQALYDAFVAEVPTIFAAFKARESGRAIRAIMALADKANQYIADKAPWTLIKTPGNEAEVQRVCSVGLNLFRVLTAGLSPVVPTIAGKAQAFLQETVTDLSQLDQPLLASAIAPFKPLAQRIEESTIEQLLAANKTPSENAKTGTSKVDNDVIDIETFAKTDLRVARIIAAQPVEDADKLLALQLDVGDHQRQVFAGIKQAYPDPHELVDRLVVVVANLAPRKMRFGVSEGMVLAAGPGGDEVFLLSPDSGAKPGQKVK